MRWHDLNSTARFALILPFAVLVGLALRPLSTRLYGSDAKGSFADLGTGPRQYLQPRMDMKKCAALKARLNANPADPLVDYKTFFNGNDDLASIGCNLSPHPGIASFERAFDRLLARDDVQAVYMSIYEIDPSEDAWPYSELVVVVGDITSDDLFARIESLEPDEILALHDVGLPQEVLGRIGRAGWAVWWD